MIKVFKMLHPGVNNSVIVYEEVQNMVWTVQFHCHSATRTIIQESTQLHTPIDVGQATIVNVV